MWGNTFFEKNINKFIWVNCVNGSKNLLDFIPSREEDRKRLLYVNVFWDAGMGISDYYLTLTKRRCLKKNGWEG